MERFTIVYFICFPVIQAASSVAVTSAADTSRAPEAAASEGEEAQQPAAAADTTVTARQDDTLALSETMDITTVPDEHLTSTPLPAKDGESSGTADKKPEKEESAVLEDQLQLAVEVCMQKRRTLNSVLVHLGDGEVHYTTLCLQIPVKDPN